MKAAIDSLECSPAPDSFPIKVVIIYEDFASGTRAKHFAERLGECLGSTCPLSETMWRGDLLESWPIAEAATRAAADCDYFIVSLGRDAALPPAAHAWLDAQLDGAAARDAGLIVLLDSSQEKWRVVEGTRHYFRALCAAKGVAFFSHAVTPHADGAVEPDLAELQWMPAVA